MVRSNYTTGNGKFSPWEAHIYSIILLSLLAGTNLTIRNAGLLRIGLVACGLAITITLVAICYSCDLEKVVAIRLVYEHSLLLHNNKL